MSYYSRYSGGGGSYRDRRGSFHDRRERGGRNWFRGGSRNWTPYRGRDDDDDRQDYRRYRRDRDEEIVLIRRDQGRRSDQPHSPLPPPTNADNRDLIRRSPDIRNHYDFNEDNRLYSEHGHPGDPAGLFYYNSNGDRVEDVTPNNFGHAPSQAFEQFTAEHGAQSPQSGASPSSVTLTAEQQEIINRCISNFKTRGDYDQIRRECMLDVDTKPAFINAMAKVTDITSRYLQTAQYHPHMDKAKMRDNLKKSFDLSLNYHNRVESLINQILLPKIPTILNTMVEAEIHNALGLTTSNTEEDTQIANGEVKEESNHSKDYSSFDAIETYGVINDIVQAPSTVSCLPPMNVIMDSENVRSSPLTTVGGPTSPSVTHPNTSDETDLQLHLDILAELKSDTDNTNTPWTAVSESIAQNENELVATLLVEETDQKNILDQKVVETVQVDSLKDTDILTVPLEPVTNEVDLKNEKDEQTVTSAGDVSGIPTEVFKLIPTSQNVEIINERNEQQSELNHENGEVVDDNDFATEDETETDEESPLFEKIGEVSPVRVDAIPLDEFSLFNDTIQQTNEVKESLLVPEKTSYTSLCTLTATKEEVIEQSKNAESIEKEVNCVVNEKTSEAAESVCKFLSLVELPHYVEYERKRFFFGQISNLSPRKGKTIQKHGHLKENNKTLIFRLPTT